MERYELMELQLPLILFTTLIAWSAGLFATQCVCSVKNVCQNCQLPAWICSAALLALSGLAVFTHLEHWERIFNGFGHLTSGITQELIAIVVLAVIAIAYLVFLRKGDRVPVWLAVLGAAMSLVLVAVCGHSYVMAARPAWDSIIEVLSLVGASCVLGLLTMMVLQGKFEASDEAGETLVWRLALGGAVVNAAVAVAYIAFMAFAGSAVMSVGFYFDPINPTEGMIDSTSLSPLAAGSIPFTAVSVIGAVVAAAAAFFGKKNTLAMGTLGTVAAVVGTVCLRVLFYQMGFAGFVLF